MPWTFLQVVGWTAALAALAAAAAVALAWLVSPPAASPSRGGLRPWDALFLMPPLMVAYYWSDLAGLAWVRQPGRRDLLYVLLNAARLWPLAALVLAVTPPATPATSLHLAWLAGAGRPLSRRLPAFLGHALRHRGHALALAAAVTFLLAYNEHEMASLLPARTWTVALFDAHVGGLSLAQSLPRAALAAAPSLLAIALAAALALAALRFPAPAAEARRPRPRSIGLTLLRLAVLLACAAVVLLIPGGFVLTQLPSGLPPMLRPWVIGPDLLVSTWLSLLAAGLALLTAGLLTTAGRRSLAGGGPPPWLLGLAATALLGLGLLGDLPLALATLALTRGTPLYDTTVPLILALTLRLIPPAVLFCLALAQPPPPGVSHTTALLAAAPDRRRRIALGLRLSHALPGRAAALAALFLLAYANVTLPALLAPPGVTPITVTLYNAMHYGRSQVLSAMVAVSLLGPLLLLAGAAVLSGRLRKWSRHG